MLLKFDYLPGIPTFSVFDMATGVKGGGKAVTRHIMRLGDVAQEHHRPLMPIHGYEKMSLVPLERAVEPLIHLLPAVRDYANVAKQNCRHPANGLSQDESASIMLYTMEWKPHDECLYVVLNATLRSANRDKLKPWFLYMKLLLSALSRLPPTNRFAYRGVKLDLSRQYPTNKTIVWWGLSSCTASIDILQAEEFLGKTGTRTMFTIECYSGRNIHKHSDFPSENEVLLPPGIQFKVVGCLDQGNDLHTVQLQEIRQTTPVLHPVSVEVERPSHRNESVRHVLPHNQRNPTRIQTISDSITGSYILTDFFSAKTISGDIRLTLRINESTPHTVQISTSTVSGDTRIFLTGSVKQITIYSTHTSMSGDVRLDYPNDWNGSIQLHAVSGDVIADRSVKVTARNEGLFEGTRGNGTNRIRAQSTSGDTTLTFARI